MDSGGVSIYTVKEAAKKLNLSVHTIRYYDNQKLIPGSRRDEHNQRVFDDEQLEWIQIVRCLRKTDMSIAAIREFIDLYLKGSETLEQRKEILDAQKQKVEKEIRKLENSRAFLDLKIEHYDLMLEHKSDENLKDTFAKLMDICLQNEE